MPLFTPETPINVRVAGEEKTIFVSEFQFSCARAKIPIVVIGISYTRELKLVKLIMSLSGRMLNILKYVT